MKRVYQKLLILLFANIVSTSAFSYDCEVDGIYYNLNMSEKTASVTFGNWRGNYNGEIDIPPYVVYEGISYKVVNIETEAFYRCSGLTSVMIPNSVTSIGTQAFYECRNLTSITIGNGVTIIWHNAFTYCSGLKSIMIPMSVTSIKEGAFFGCTGQTSITVQDGNPVYDSRENCNAIIRKSDNTLLVGCKNTIIPNSVTSIERCAFWGCGGLTSVTIPNNVMSIGDNSFGECYSLTSITVLDGNSVYDSREGCNAIIRKSDNTLLVGCKNTIIPNSVTSIGNYAFSGCSGLTSVTIPNSVTSIGYDAFRHCSSLTSITIPNSVTTIGGYTFRGCSGLTSFTIPNSVTTIGDYAFDGCIGLTDLYCCAEIVPTTSNTSFYGTPINNAILHVPETSIDDYKATAPWNGFKEIVVLIKGDANNDGKVNAADIVEVINAKDGHQSASFIMNNADMDGSGTITEADITEIVNIIMGK